KRPGRLGSTVAAAFAWAPIAQAIARILDHQHVDAHGMQHAEARQLVHHIAGAAMKEDHALPRRTSYPPAVDLHPARTVQPHILEGYLEAGGRAGYLAAWPEDQRVLPNQELDAERERRGEHEQQYEQKRIYYDRHLNS